MKISTKQIYLRKIRRTLTARSQNLRKRKGAWWVKSIPSISILSDEWKLYHLYCDGFSFNIKAREIEQEKKKYAQVIMRFRCFFIHILFVPINMFSTWQKKSAFATNYRCEIKQQWTWHQCRIFGALLIFSLPLLPCYPSPFQQDSKCVTCFSLTLKLQWSGPSWPRSTSKAKRESSEAPAGGGGCLIAHSSH